MKKKIVTIISVALAICLTFALSISLAFCGRSANTSDSETNLGQDGSANVGDENQGVIGGETHAVKLAMSAYTMNRETKTVSRTLTATVLPEDAPDRSVDWTLEWCVPVYDGADISDYLTIEPEYDGALSATVTAYQGFEGGSAYVTCTTRVGGYSAQCLITYDGAPESLGEIGFMVLGYGSDLLIPLLGYLDDVILLPMLVALTIKFIPDEVLEEKRQQAKGMWQDGKPKKWYYAIPIVLIWILIIALILKAII